MGNKLIKTAFTPTVPMWAVYWDCENRELFTEPVLALAVVDEIDPEDGAVISSFLSPQVLTDSRYLDDPMDEWNFLGYAMDEDPVPPDWENEIEQAKKKRTKMVERLLAD